MCDTICAWILGKQICKTYFHWSLVHMMRMYDRFIKDSCIFSSVLFIVGYNFVSIKKYRNRVNIRLLFIYCKCSLRNEKCKGRRHIAMTMIRGKDIYWKRKVLGFVSDPVRILFCIYILKQQKIYNLNLFCLRINNLNMYL